MTNPPVPATPLDVEACVRLLPIIAAWHKAAVHGVPESKLRDFHEGVIAMAEALASALPGMGKDSARYAALRRTAEDPFYAALEFREILRRNETLDAFADSRIDVWAQRDAIDVAARAAQPEETSADAE